MSGNLIAISLLAVAISTSAAAQSIRSPSGDPTGATKGIASDVDPVGEAVGNEPAMIDPHSTGSVELEHRATIDCAKKTDAGKRVVQKDNHAACK